MIKRFSCLDSYNSSDNSLKKYDNKYIRLNKYFEGDNRAIKDIQDAYFSAYCDVMLDKSINKTEYHVEINTLINEHKESVNIVRTFIDFKYMSYIEAVCQYIDENKYLPEELKDVLCFSMDCFVGTKECIYMEIFGLSESGESVLGFAFDTSNTEKNIYKSVKNFLDRLALESEKIHSYIINEELIFEKSMV